MRRRSLYFVAGLMGLLLILVSFQLPFKERLKKIVNDVNMPLLQFWSGLQDRSGFLIGRVKTYAELQTENTSLKEKISALSVKVAQSSELERENGELRSMLAFKNRSDIRLVSARVIARDPSNWWNTVLIDRGSEDGVTRDMPVLTVDGLVGKTILVNKSTTQVLLLVDENCKVSGWIPERAQYGIVQGNILSGGTSAQCRMTYIDRYAKIKPTDQVQTSGLGGIFPKGIPVGRVASVNSAIDSERGVLYQEVNITPAVDLARIDEVFIGIGMKDSPVSDQDASQAPEKEAKIKK